jgi:trans-aconitate methyltransferase
MPKKKTQHDVSAYQQALIQTTPSERFWLIRCDQLIADKHELLRRIETLSKVGDAMAKQLPANFQEDWHDAKCDKRPTSYSDFEAGGSSVAE